MRDEDEEIPDRTGAFPAEFAVVLGGVALGADVFIALNSFTAFDPPDWMRMVSLALFAMSVAAGLFFGLIGCMGTRRKLAIIGLCMTLAALAFYLVIYAAGG